MTLYAKLWLTLARAHARSGDRIAIAIQRVLLDRAICEASEA
jgi:hypothetical protein